jgi:hypothetical protein
MTAASAASAISIQCIDTVKAGLLPFVQREMKSKYGPEWERKAECRIVTGKPHWDLQAVLKTMLVNWRDVFESALPSTAKSYVFELKDWRNHVAHEHELNVSDVCRFVDTATRLLKLIGAPEAAALEELLIALRKQELASAIAAVEPSAVVRATVQTPRSHAIRTTPPSPTENTGASAPAWVECVARISRYIGSQLTVKAGRVAFSGDRNVAVCCLVSKEYPGNRYWWNLRGRQLSDMAPASTALVAFACGTPEQILAIPVTDIATLLPTLNPKPGHDGEGWHVHILHEGGRWWLLQSGRNNRVEITDYLLRAGGSNGG